MPSIRTVIIHNITSPKFKAPVSSILYRAARWGARSGYEASAVDHTFSGLRGLWATVKAELSTKYNDSDALAMLNEPVKPVHSYNPLVQIHSDQSHLEETRA